MARGHYLRTHARAKIGTVARVESSAREPLHEFVVTDSLIGPSSQHLIDHDSFISTLLLVFEVGIVYRLRNEDIVRPPCAKDARYSSAGYKTLASRQAVKSTASASEGTSGVGMAVGVTVHLVSAEPGIFIVGSEAKFMARRRREACSGSYPHR